MPYFKTETDSSWATRWATVRISCSVRLRVSSRALVAISSASTLSLVIFALGSVHLSLVNQQTFHSIFTHNVYRFGKYFYPLIFHVHQAFNKTDYFRTVFENKIMELNSRIFRILLNYAFNIKWKKNAKIGNGFTA